jgi:RNA polymerase sigma factor (sigma-70 family)
MASDERLVALTRAGNQAAYEVIVGRYQSRLLSFCARIVGSREDAEDVLQEVFAASYNALIADDREINLRPWLYRIARNRSLNQLRRHTAIGVDSMDIHLAEMGISTSEKVFRRENFKLMIEDIGTLPESQRTALLLREMEGMTYEQIAEAMDQTVPGIKSLLVRARIGLAEAAEARKLSCADVRLALGEAAEGLGALSQPVRRHVKGCERCAEFRRTLRSNNRALAALTPFGPLLLLKHFLVTKLSGATAGGGAAAAGGTAAAGTGSAGAFTVGAVAAKALATVAAAAIVAVVAVGHGHSTTHHHAVARIAAPASPPLTLTAGLPRVHHSPRRHHHHASQTPTTQTSTAALDTASTAPATGAPTATTPAAPPVTSEEVTTTTVIPSGATGTTATSGSTAPASTAGTGATSTTTTTGTTGTTGATGSGSTGATGATSGGATGSTGPT